MCSWISLESRENNFTCNFLSSHFFFAAPLVAVVDVALVVVVAVQFNGAHIKRACHQHACACT